MNRRKFLQVSVVGAGSLQLVGASSVQAAATRKNSRADSFRWSEASIRQLQNALEKGEESSVSLAQKYLERIDRLDHDGPRLRAVIELNPEALGIARTLDRERKQGRVRGPLHGLPVLIKDNIDTSDRMTTTAGSLALQGSKALRDAFLVRKLRAAGAVILGKTNLSEWANFRGSRSTSGWSGRGGLTRNPYALDRNPSGSSSGSAVAVSANLCSVAVGTETDGSIISPSTVCGIVGLKPTLGLISRSGIIPIAHSQDTAGPMTRTVEDAAILLGVLAGVDPDDQDSASPKEGTIDYSTFLDPNGLKGARLGVARKYFRTFPGDKTLEDVLKAMKQAGAVLVDPADLPSHGKFGDSEYEVLLYEFKADLNRYLTSLGPRAPIKSLQEAIEFNEKHHDRELKYFGQETFLKAQEKGPLTDKAYLEAREKCLRVSRTEGLDAVFQEHRLDALIAPSGGPAGMTDLVHGDRGIGGSSSPAAMAGYPNITVPAGDWHGLPFGLSFMGPSWSEGKLLKLAFAFEKLVQARRAPTFLETVG